MGVCAWRSPARFLLVLGVLEGVHACAADPKQEVTDAAATDSREDAAPSDLSTFESDAPVNCLTTMPSTVPVKSDAGEETCRFQITPPLPAVDFSYGVFADGARLLSQEFELRGRDTLELIGQGCVDYLAGTITNVSVIVNCIQ